MVTATSTKLQKHINKIYKNLEQLKAFTSSQLKHVERLSTRHLISKS